ncbi:PLxRFG domain-containing protein [Ottowia thiooxydans]|uniref:PLxRFG domain-containing protein n=1 Tax=Ottowia thiooxydans TaxID=219182 RepID=UPI0004002DC0|nr:PLxRFG domain-containing protein [Ottowia thiooxydans]
MADVNWNDFTPVDSPAPVDWSQFEVIKPTSAGRKLADLGVSFAGGALGATKAIVDSTGAGSQASQTLGNAQDTVQGWLSPGRQAERAARDQIIKDAEKSGSSLQEIGAHLGGIAEAPISTVAEAAGSATPIVASMFTPGGRSAAARRLLGIGLGAAQGAGSVKGSVYDAVEKQHLDRGEAPEAARQLADQAQAYTGPNADNIAIGAGIGAVSGTTGVEGMVSRTLAGKGSTSGLLRRMAMGTVSEGLPEAVQGGQERFSANVAQQRAGFDVPTWEGVAGQATAEGVAGGMLGGAASTVEGRGARRHAREAALNQSRVDERTRLSADAALAAAADARAKGESIAPTWTTDLGAADPLSDFATDVASPANAPGSADVDFGTSPGAAAPREGGIDFTREVDTSGLSLVDPARVAAEAAQSARHSIDFAPVDTTPSWTTEPGAQAQRTGMDVPPIGFDTGELGVDTRSPSQRMGIDPADGPLSRGAAMAVDSVPAQQQIQVPQVDPWTIDSEQIANTESVDPGFAGLPQVQPAQAMGIERPENWRTNMLRAVPVAKAMGIDHKGKRLAQVVAEIDAADAKVEGRPENGADLSAGQINQEWSAFAPETGTLGIPRAEMPQIKAEHRGALVNFLKARGIDSRAAEMPANDLKPTQAEFSPEKVQRARDFTGGDRSILVSSDGYVVDGHHQWLAKRSNGAPVKVIQLKVPIQEVLAQVSEFPSTATSSGAIATPAPAVEQPKPVSQPKTETSTKASSSAASPTLAKEISRDIGVNKEGMSEFRAKQVRNELARKNPEVSYTVEEDDSLKNGYAVVGRKPAPERVEKLSLAKPEVVAAKAPPLPDDAPVERRDSSAALDDFGERLEGARKFLPPSLKEEVADDQISSLPLSKIWPSDAHEGIEDDSAAALAFAARQEVPVKPRTAYKLPAWVEKVKVFRSLVQDMGGNLAEMERRSDLTRSGSLTPFFTKVRLLAQLPRESWSRVGKASEHPDAYRVEDGKTVANPFSVVTIDGESHIFGGVKRIGPDEVERVKELLGTATPKKGGLKAADFEIRRQRNDGTVFVNRKGDSERRPLRTFAGDDAVTQARAWLNAHAGEAEATWEQVKARDNVAKTDTRREDNRQRTGESRRDGKDVTPEMFEQALGFRGVQFGEWVGQGKGAKERQGLLNEAYDSLLDLSELLGIPSRAISLNGTLGLSFGARGSGKAAAHFEPSNLVINLTKTRGSGSLAHEWFHALDNYFSRLRGGEATFTGDQAGYRKNNFITYRPEPAWVQKVDARGAWPVSSAQLRERLKKLTTYDPAKTLEQNAEAAGWQRDPSHKLGVRPEVEGVFAELVQSLNDSPMAKRASSLDKGAEGYWGRIIERGARSFENYVIGKLAQRGWSNDFLANVRDWQEWEKLGKNADRYPYLRPEEEASVATAFDKLFETVDTRQDEAGNVGLFSRSEGGGIEGESPVMAKPSYSPQARAQAIASVQKTVEAIRAAWGNSPDVIVAFDMSDPAVPDSARRADLRQRSGGARGTPEGFYYNGKAYLLASKLRTPNDAARVLFHEVLGHHGLRGVFGKDLDKVLDQIATMRRAEVDAKIKEYGLRGVSGLDRRTAAEEVLAEMAQSQPTIGFVKRAIAAIRTWLRQNVPGFHNLRMSDDEIVKNFILPARTYVERGLQGAQPSGAATAFSRSDDKIVEPVTLNLQGWDGSQAQLRALAGGWYTENLQGKSFHNDDMEVDVQFSSEGKRTAFATSGNLRMGWRAEMVRALPDLVKRAVKVGESAPDSRRAHDTKAFHTLVVPLEVNGKVLAAKVTLRESLLDPYGKLHKFYDIAAVEIENGSEMSGVAPDVSTGPVHPTGSEPSGISVSDLEKIINPAAQSGEVRFSRGPAERVGEAIRSVTVSDIKRRADFKAADLRPLGLQFLGRRQLMDVYGESLPELRSYNDMMARMDADKNEAGAGADQLARDWSKLSDEGALADLMHDTTLAQMDPSKPFVEGDNRLQYGALRKRFESLSPGAKDIYARARDTYNQHMQEVRSAIKERIQRADMSSERRAAMLKRLDDEFFGRVKGVYFPLARFGQYVVVVKGADGKVENVSRAETMAEADTVRRQLLSAFPSTKGFNVGKVLKAKDFVADRDSVGRGFMEQLYGVLDKQGMDAKQRAELEDALGQLYLSSLPDLSWAKHGIHRKGTAGFSQDARRAFAQNVFHGASYLAKLRYGDQLQEELAQMQKRVDAAAGDVAFDSVKAQQVVDEMAKRHDAAMNPKTNALSTALTSFGFMFHLGLSPASAMVNLTQTALVAYPVMGARWGFAKSSAALLKASQETVRGKNDITTALNPEERKAFDEAVRAGVVDVTMAHDLAGIAQGEDRNVSYKLRPAMRAASFLFHHAEKFNRQVSFVAAYRLAREAGTEPGVAYEQAVKATYDGHFDYSSNNRPRVMQGNVARVLLLFKQYGQNMVYTFARSAQQALKGATPEDRALARKTLAGLLTSHAMAAGVLGLPMVTTLLAAASMLGGDDDEPWDAQVALQNLLADTFGQKPAEVLAHGLSRMTPWDISGRVGLDKLIFPDIQEGLEGQRLGESAMAAALGPVAGIGINALKGLQEMSHGRYQLGLEAMAPSFLRGPLKAFRYETEGVKDKTGIVIQDEVDSAAMLGQAAGFSPSSVRNSYEGKSAIVGHDRALQARRSALVERFAMAAMSNDEEGKAEAREAVQRFNEKNPGRRIQPMQLAQSVRQREKRIREAEDGVWLPKKRRDAAEVGRFATGE